MVQSNTEKAAYLREWRKKNRRVDLESEIAKCDVRCANCHAVRTWKK